MRTRLVGIPALCSLAAWGCVHADLGGRDAGPDEKAQVDGGVGGAAGPDGPADRPDGAAGRDGGPDADTGMVDGGDAADARDARDLGIDTPGADVPAPTCSDNTQNSDETDMDCGGHCGKCGAGRKCLIGVDCIFGVCKVNHTCGECLVAADCPGVETPCLHRACTAGVCSSVREAVGRDLPVQTSRDCKSNQCAADGTVIAVDDASDLPDDQNPCTQDFCMAGTPSHTSLPLNSPCGGQNKCNATGQCRGCIVAGDCPGTDNACQTRTCSAAGICGFNFQPAGTRLADPTAGDCKGVECDGRGGNQPVSEDRDVPIDGNACTTDDCSAGTPSHRPVASGTTCGTGLVCDGANRCVTCLSASTCPGTDTECHTRTCLNGACGISNKLSGTVTVAQVARDCKRSQCDGLGNVANAPDTTDLPVDNNVCTQDICTRDVPSNPALPSGSGCGGTSVCDGQGACVGCVTAATCPGTDTECHARACINRGCAVTNTPAGTLLFTQTNGDCKRNQCDGSGNTQVVNDDRDVPIDGNPCTADACSGGVATNPSLPSGTACGTGLLCNDAGGCVGCRTAADCPGTDTACQFRTCSAAGRCGVTNIGAGMALTTQTAGNCKRDQCDGTGHVVTVPDDADPPVDGLDCTMDLCSQGFPSNPPQPRDTPCAQNNGSRCNGLAGPVACVQCTAASQCPGGPDTECHTRTCSAAGACGITLAAAGTAVAAQTTGDCKRNQCDAAGQIVAMTDAQDRPVDGNPCTKDLCTGSTPSNPPEDARTTCSNGGNGALCNGVGACVQCIGAADCPGGPDTACRVRTCSAAGVCGANLGTPGAPIPTQSPGDCHSDVCDSAGAIISVIDNTDLFVDGKSCTGDVCMNGVASNPPVVRGATCAENGGVLCDGAGICAQCLTDAQCDSSHDMPCNKNHCVLGACTFVPEPMNTPLPDPTPGDCYTNACDGTGGVSSVPSDGDAPLNTNICVSSITCVGGIPMTQYEPPTTVCSLDPRYCDGAGTCLPAAGP